MTHEDFRLLAGVIAAHSNRTVTGRTRLQKEIMLLQRLGLPTTYRFSMHFHGPYSDGLQADVRLLESLGFVTEKPDELAGNGNGYVITANPRADLSAVEGFRKYVEVMEKEDATVLELAATYDAFRAGSDHGTAIDRLRKKKGPKCEGGRETKALALLRRFDLPAE